MSKKVIDLSQTIDTGMQLFPLHSPTHVIPWAPRDQYGWTTNALFINEHAGTHLDAPFHFMAEGKTIDEVDPSILMGPALVLDFSAKWPQGSISASDIEAATRSNPIRPGDALVFRTGAAAHQGEPAALDSYPGLNLEGAQFLVESGIRLVGTDAASIDHPEAAEFPVHRTLLPAGVLVVENLSNLDTLLALVGDRHFELYTFPLKIRGGSGSPIRAVGVFDG